MARRKIDLSETIKQQEEVVLKAKDRYDREVAELDRLLTKRKEMESRKLMLAFEKSDRSIDEILAFLGTGDEAEQD